MFAKRKNRGNIRKRSGADDSDNEDDDATVVKKNKVNTGSALTFSTAKDSKQEVEGVVLRHESDKTIQQRGDGGATRHLETETAYDRDARAIREKVLKQGRGEEAPQDGKYRGMAAYVDYRKGFRGESSIAAEKGGGAHGPMRGTAFLRMSVQVDYKPDLCKDYKETGYCSYGDSCKFLHDRSDYKSGWELEREWEAEQKRKMERMANSVAGAGDGDEDADEDEDGDDDDELPFACAICRRSWAEAKDPVVTRCGHYFCEQCALRHHAAKKGRCFLCESATNGIFNVATDILKRMKQQGNQPPGRTGPGG